MGQEGDLRMSGRGESFLLHIDIKLTMIRVINTENYDANLPEMSTK